MNCSVCQAEMVKSGVGWLCPECGNLQPHDRIPEGTPIIKSRATALHPAPADELAPNADNATPVPVTPVAPAATLAEPTVPAAAPPPAPPAAVTVHEPTPSAQPKFKPFELVSRPIAIVIGLAGLALAIAGWSFLPANQHPLNYKTTSGVVIKTAAGQAIIQFTLQDHSYSFSDASKTQLFSPGDRVSLAYNPKQPDVSPINLSDKTTSLAAIVLIGTGIILLVVGLVGFISTFFESTVIEPASTTQPVV